MFAMCLVFYLFDCTEMCFEDVCQPATVAADSLQSTLSASVQATQQGIGVYVIVDGIKSNGVTLWFNGNLLDSHVHP